MRLLPLLVHAATAVTVVWAVALSSLFTPTGNVVLRRGIEPDEAARRERAANLLASHPEAQRQADGKYYRSRKAANSCLEYRLLRAILRRDTVMLTLTVNCEDLSAHLTRSQRRLHMRKSSPFVKGSMAFLPYRARD